MNTGSTMDTKKRVVAIAMDQDGFKASNIFSRFLLKPGDDVHILSVKHNVPGYMVPMPSVMSNGENSSIVTDAVYAHTKQDEQERVDQLLRAAAESPIFNNFHPKIHALDPIGGASGVGESLVQWCKENNVDLLCVGTREKSAIGISIMTMLGFGSVSKYSVNKLKIPVCIVHGPEKKPSELKKVAICMNGSESTHSLKWVCENLANSGDVEIHIISVPLKPPYDIVEEDSTAAHVLSNQEHDDDSKRLCDLAEKSVQDSLQFALDHGMTRPNLMCKVLEPREGSTEIAESINKYVEENKIDLVCMGRRNLSPLKRTLESWFGLGSVSDWCTSHLKASLLIVPEVASDGSQ